MESSGGGRIAGGKSKDEVLAGVRAAVAEALGAAVADDEPLMEVSYWPQEPRLTSGWHQMS